MAIPITLVLLFVFQSADAWGSEVFSLSNIHFVSVTLAGGAKDG